MEQVKIVKVFKADVNLYLRPWILAGLLDREFFQMGTLDEKLIEMAQILKDCENFPEEIYETDWEEVTNEFLNPKKDS